jgi:hypothetical protein
MSILYRVWPGATRPTIVVSVKLVQWPWSALPATVRFDISCIAMTPIISRIRSRINLGFRDNDILPTEEQPASIPPNRRQKVQKE